MNKLRCFLFPWVGILPASGLHIGTGKADPCEDRLVLAWLVQGAHRDLAPPCLEPGAAELLAEDPTRAAEVFARWATPGRRWFGAPSVNRLEMFGVPVRFFNNDMTPDVGGARPYDLDHHRVPSGGLVVEVGSHVGMVAAILSKLNPDAHVITFEPSVENRFFVELNLALNRVSYAHGEPQIRKIAKGQRGTVQVRSEAVSGIDGVTFFELSGDKDCSHMVSNKSPSSYQVRTKTLGRVLAESGAAKIDLLKIDCEGCEYRVLGTMDSSTLGRLGHVTGEAHAPASPQGLGMMCANHWHMQHLQCLPAAWWSPW